MKKQYFYVLACFLFSLHTVAYGLTNEPVTAIHFSFPDIRKGQKVVLAIKPTPFTDQVKHTIDFDSRGMATLELGLKYDQPATILLNQQFISNVYIPKGEGIGVILSNQSDKTICVFSGTKARENRLLLQLRKDDLLPVTISSFYAGITEPFAYRRYLEERRARQLEIIKQWDKEIPLSEAFKAHVSKEVKYAFLNSLFVHEISYGTMLEKEIRPDFFKGVDAVDFNTDFSFSSLMYQEAIRYYVQFYLFPYTRSKFEDDSNLKVFYNTADSVFTGSTRYYAMAHFIGMARMFKLEDAFNTLLNDFLNKCTDTEIRELILAEYGSANRDFKGRAFPDVVMKEGLETIEGRKLSFNNMLDHYRGKLIYLDLWSVGCKPCIKEFPNSARLSKELRGKDVAFVYLSIDGGIYRDKPDQYQTLWSKYTAETGGKENHYILHSTASIMNWLQFNAIPRYLILDKEGRIIDADADRPGDKKTEKLLQDLLK
ncbi:MAG: TlpA family protein disulfide reductase [Cyclobacteriaceae bacterium]|nr:TlpA family protein disulfide reductase [Cyclobacteriaceae bacterium]